MQENGSLFSMDQQAPPGQLVKQVLSDQVKEFIIDAITRGELQSGDRVVTSALASDLGVSQAPVREAIRDLVLMGFLVAEPYKGTTVRSFTAKELYDVYTVRASLESLAARLACDRLTKEHIKVLRATLEEMIEAARRQDTQRMVQLDNDFHRAILRIAENEFLYQLWQTLQFGHWTIVTTRVSTYNLEELARRHEALLEALASGDPQTAALAMQHHIEDLGKPPQNLDSKRE